MPVLYADSTPLLEIALRCGIVYFAVLAMMRVSGKRHVAQLSIVDFVLVLLISNAVQNAMVGPDNSLVGGLVAAAVLMVLNQVLTRGLLMNERLGRYLEGEPTLLIRDGRMLDNHLMRECVRRAELEAAIREHGYEDAAQIKQAILEIDGSISVIPYGEDHKEHRIPPIQRHKRVGRRGYRPGDK
jgi:uncharacterized membrane protein YcaP (DUF421 family)